MSTFSGKRLAKNTLLMYFRLGIGIIVNFIITKVVFNVLGVDNYGLYGVVAGIIILFSFVSSAIASSAQRFFSYELGKNNYEKLKEIYNALVRIFCIISIIIVFLAETIGLWFLNTQMDFPDGKLGLANFVYQVSIITTIAQVFKIPYDAAIISTEKFNFYAYTSLINAFLQLGVAYLLKIIPLESTKVYVVLLLAVALIMLLWYFIYCRKKIQFIRFSKKVNKNVFRELLSFVGWSFFGALCNMGYRQGVNVVINVFFGVVLNAAFSIANQVSALVNQFVTGFQSAYNPQITKTCSVGSAFEQTKIVSMASKISFSLLLIVGFCVLLNIDVLLNLWLGEIPSKTTLLCSLMVVAAIIDSISDPFWIVIFATGKISKYQISCAILMIGNVLLTILAFLMGYGVEISMYIRIVMNIGIMLVRLFIVNNQTPISILSFITNVLVKDLLVVLILLPVFLVANNLSDGYIRLFLSTPICVVIILLLLAFVLFEKSEREAVKRMILSKCRR